MKLFVIVLCLLSERYLIHSLSYQRFYWFTEYYQKIKKLAVKNNFNRNPWVLLAAIVIPILFATLIIYAVFYYTIFGLIGFVLNLVILFYCFGPQNVFYPVYQSDTKNNEQMVEDYFVLINRQLFSLVFWYIITGPIGALAYRLITLCQRIEEVSEQAKEVTDLLEWLPSRFTVFLFLLVGNFQRGFTFFKRFVFAKPDTNSTMLKVCGMQAVKTNGGKEIPMLAAENLIEYAIVLMLVLIALFTIISWL